MRDALLTILTSLMVIAIGWFGYSIANIVVTLVKCKKRDHDLKFCFNPLGKIFYGILTVLFIASVIGGVVFIVLGILKHHEFWWRNGLNVIALFTVIYAFFLSMIVLVGKKYMMVGRMQIDYRKLKKVNYAYNHEMSFVYNQKSYKFSTRFIEVTELRKIISK